MGASPEVLGDLGEPSNFPSSTPAPIDPSGHFPRKRGKRFERRFLHGLKRPPREKSPAAIGVRAFRGVGQKRVSPRPFAGPHTPPRARQGEGSEMAADRFRMPGDGWRDVRARPRGFSRDQAFAHSNASGTVKPEGPETRCPCTRVRDTGLGPNTGWTGALRKKATGTPGQTLSPYRTPTG